jgi:uncharacterized protein (DUF486 family)
MKGYITIGLLILSNVFMLLAWYGHLKFKELKWFILFLENEKKISFYDVII